jgi:cell division protein FtsB
MSTDNWFAALTFLAVYVVCLLMLDGAHKAHITALKGAHREQVAGLRSYIRTLSRERLWLEAEVQRLKDKVEREQVQAAPEHIQWLPPSEEYGEG